MATPKSRAVIPAALPLAQVFYGQFVTFDPSENKIWVTNAFTINVSG